MGRHKPVQPERAVCVIGDSGCICFDPRLPVDQQNYVKTFRECINYQAMEPQDYNNLQGWISLNCYGPKAGQ